MEEAAFAEVVEMTQAARGRAFAAVNTALVDLYWQVGEYISRKLATAAWGEGVVDELARYIQRRHPGLRGFTRRHLFRMRQFFEAYAAEEKVSALLTQLPWTHHLLILGRCKRAEERWPGLRAQPCSSSTAAKRLLQAKLHELYAWTAVNAGWLWRLQAWPARRAIRMGQPVRSHAIIGEIHDDCH